MNYNSIDLLKIAGKSSAEIKKEFPNMICEEVIHKDNLDTKLNIESVALSRDNVIIKGAEYKL